MILPATQSFIDGSGELVSYRDAFGNVTKEHVKEAEILERRILECMGRIKASYIQLGDYLDEFDRKNLYLARGYESFKDWVSSPEINIGSRVAHDLLRIVREALPVLAEHNSMEVVSSINISTMRALLPILKSEGSDKFVQVAKEVGQATVREAYKIIDLARGKAASDAQIIAFARKHDYSPDTITLEIMFITDIETYNIGRMVMSEIQMREFAKVFRAPIEWS